MWGEKNDKMEIENLEMRTRFSGEVSVATVPHFIAAL